MSSFFIKLGNLTLSPKLPRFTPLYLTKHVQRHTAICYVTKHVRGHAVTRYGKRGHRGYARLCRAQRFWEYPGIFLVRLSSKSFIVHYYFGFLNVSKMLYCANDESSAIDWNTSSHPSEARSFISWSSSSIFSDFGFLTPALAILDGILNTSLLYSFIITLSLSFILATKAHTK